MKILIFGSKGMVGSSLVNILSKYDSYQVVPSSENTDLFELNQTKYFIEKTNPDIVINAAAMVGGIYANNTQRS